MVSGLLSKHFKNSPDGIPGNDDTGTMSAWAVFSMMGIYPVNPAEPMYALTKPKFDKITIHLDGEYYRDKALVIKSGKSFKGEAIQKISIDGKPLKGYFISHQDLVNTSEFIID